MTFYCGALEKERREKWETPERILFIAVRDGAFQVSLRYRDDWLRARCEKLRKKGYLKRGVRMGDRISYKPVDGLELTV